MAETSFDVLIVGGGAGGITVRHCCANSTRR
jgi:glycerol-3-phosphate dehydrogenase